MLVTKFKKLLTFSVETVGCPTDALCNLEKGTRNKEHKKIIVMS